MRFAKQNLDLIATVLKALLTGVVLGVLIFGILQVVPIYVKSYEFEQATKKEARLAATNLESGPFIQEDIYQKARQIGVPVEKQQISVDSGARESHLISPDSVLDPSVPATLTGIVNIEVSYAVPVRFPGYTLELRFHFHADDRSI